MTRRVGWASFLVLAAGLALVCVWVVAADNFDGYMARAVAGFGGFASLFAVVIGLSALEQAQEAQRESSRAKRLDRLERIAQLVLTIQQEAFALANRPIAGSQDRWRFARRELRIALAAAGPDVDGFADVHALAEIPVERDVGDDAVFAAESALEELAWVLQRIHDS